jgi:prophage tail gpP-like protein
MGDTLCRISFTRGTPSTIASGSAAPEALPCKEWSITDDVLNLADMACVTVDNANGRNANVFSPGQRVELDLRNDAVAGGAPVRSFTGVVTGVRYGSDASAGSVIQITMMDVGWYLTACCATPQLNIKNLTIAQLLAALIDPSWGITQVVSSNDLNRRLKHGRQVIIQNLQPVLGAVLPYIQVEPGQKPADILDLYAKRAGVLLNSGADGSLILFQPNSSQQALYGAYYDPTNGGLNNIVGRPTREETIDGLYTQTTCFSTVVIDPAISGLANPEDPNAAFRHTTYTPTLSVLPFRRQEVMTDAEAINDTLRHNRCVWKYQMGQFQSFKYECEFDAHQQNGAFFVSDTVIDVRDDVNGVNGLYYVQSVQRSQTLTEGSRSRVIARRPGLLNPNQSSLQKSATEGVLPSSQVTQLADVKLPARILKLLGRSPIGGDKQ